MDLRFHEILRKKVEENSSAQKNAFLKIVASHRGKYQQVCTVLILITCTCFSSTLNQNVHKPISLGGIQQLRGQNFANF